LNEKLNHWKARIGSLKGAAGVGILILLLSIAVTARILITAMDNPEQPDQVTARQIVDGEVPVGRFVVVNGYAKLDHGYGVTEAGVVRYYYYYLLDDESRYLIVVRADPATFHGHSSARIEVPGMTRSAPKELQELIKNDFSDIRQAGYLTTPLTYLEENARPPEKLVSITTMLVLGFGLVLFSATFFFPSTLFQPMPVETFRIVDRDAAVDHTIWARGTFRKLNGLYPFIEFGGRNRRFRDTPVNVRPLPDHQILIQPLVHEGRRRLSLRLGHQSFDFSVGTAPDQWAIVVDEENFIDMDPGKLYGWIDRWALRLRYSLPGAGTQTVILSFQNPIAQAECVDRLREIGFLVGMWIT